MKTVTVGLSTGAAVQFFVPEDVDTLVGAEILLKSFASAQAVITQNPNLVATDLQTPSNIVRTDILGCAPMISGAKKIPVISGEAYYVVGTTAVSVAIYFDKLGST